MKFVDSIQIRIKSGAGGPGLVSFRTARNRPKLGADGGDGGFGGNVFLVGRRNLSTLSGLVWQREYAAGGGERGGANGRTGADGADCLIGVPLGTIAYDANSGEQLCEILDDQQRCLVAQGGKRGLGNRRYLTSTRQAPQGFTAGGPAVELTLRLELKLIADVGFAGLPNAGKSTLLSVISAATPKIADYPFTTLVPHLGVVTVPQDGNEFTSKSFVAADIPGIIEGASLGKGLGLSFLRHLERCKLVAFVIDASAAVDAGVEYTTEKDSLVETLRLLRSELDTYSHTLAAKPYCVVLTKEDLLQSDVEFANVESQVALIAAEFTQNIYRLSAVTGIGIVPFKRQLCELVELMQDSSCTCCSDDLPTQEVVVVEEAHQSRDDPLNSYRLLTEYIELGQ